MGRVNGKKVHPLLAAIGCLPQDGIEGAATDIYRTGLHCNSAPLRIRLVAVGSARDDTLAVDFPNVTQLIWDDMLAFMRERFRRYDKQKRQVEQWDAHGREIKRIACSANQQDFIQKIRQLMGAYHQ